MDQGIYEHMGRCIREARKARNMTQQELALAIGRGKRHIQRIEKGDVNPSFEVLYSIMEYLGISAETLFNPEMSEQDRTFQNIQAKLAVCTEDNRQFLLQTMDYMVTLSISQHQVESAKQNVEVIV